MVITKQFVFVTVSLKRTPLTTGGLKSISSVSIPMFCYGNTIGWMSPMTLLLQSDKSPKGVPLTDLEYRGTVLAITMAIASVVHLIQLLFFKPLIKALGVHVAFYFFGSMCLLTAVYVIIVVPETRNRKLEDIFDDLRSKKNKKEIENQDGL